ncbi:MAG: hypothetical protein AAF368_13320 [Planctomycetota bacterium]
MNSVSLFLGTFVRLKPPPFFAFFFFFFVPSAAAAARAPPFFAPFAGDTFVGNNC